MNAGEWSELYALLKVLADGALFGADESLEKITGWHYPVRKVTRQNSAGQNLTFLVEPKLGLVKVTGGTEITQHALGAAAQQLLQQIKAAGTFESSVIDPFLKTIGNPKIKANSADKVDLNTTLYDPHIGIEQDVGFSVKSQLGGASTLLNASKATNFIFEVEGLSPAQCVSLQEKKTRDLVGALLKEGCNITFQSVDARFSKNLRMIDSRMDEIFAYTLILFYGQHYYRQKLSALDAIVDRLENDDPLNLNHRHTVLTPTRSSKPCLLLPLDLLPPRRGRASMTPMAAISSSRKTASLSAITFITGTCFKTIFYKTLFLTQHRQHVMNSAASTKRRGAFFSNSTCKFVSNSHEKS